MATRLRSPEPVCGFSAWIPNLSLVDQPDQGAGWLPRRTGIRFRPARRSGLLLLDLGREMVRQGWALAEFGPEYRADQEQVQAARLDILVEGG